MNYLDIDKALVDITRAKCDECKARLDATPKDNKAERKALQIELGMYTVCGNAGLLFNTYGTREGLYRTRQNFWNYALLTKYPKQPICFLRTKRTKRGNGHEELKTFKASPVAP